MFRKWETNRMARWVSGPIGQRRLDDDCWRLENSFFGAHYNALFENGDILIWGACSGIEIIRFLEESASANIVVIECDQNLTDEIRNGVLPRVSASAKERVFFFESMESLLADKRFAQFSLARVDTASFSWGRLEHFLRHRRVGRLFGEADPAEVDPMRLFRVCRELVAQFHLRVVGTHIPLHFEGRKSEFEVSVVVPCYKVLPWIDRCMESLTMQTIESLEIIAVDDGSTDGTAERLDKWAEQFPGRVKVVHKENGGCASARNAGMQVAQGEFIAFVDADDWVDVSMFEELYRAACLNAAEIAQCGYAEIFEDSGQVEYYPTAWGVNEGNGRYGLVEDIKSFLVTKPTIWRRIYRLDWIVANAIVFPAHVRRFDDLPFQFEVLSRAKRMAIVPECYYYYRQEREGQDIAVRDQRLFVHFPIFSWLNDRVMTWADARLEAYLLECKFNTHVWALKRIESGLKGVYFDNGSADIQGHLRNVGASRLVLMGLRRGSVGLRLALGSLLRPLGRPPRSLPPS